MTPTVNCSECGQRLEAADEEALRERFSFHMAESHPGVQLTEGEIQEIIERSEEGSNLIKLGATDTTLEAPEHDTRGREVFDNAGEDLGRIEELYVDERERAVRFLEVRASDALGVENRNFLVPVEAVSETSEDRVALNQSREKVISSPESPAGEVPSLRHQEDSQKYYGFGAYHD